MSICFLTDKKSLVHALKRISLEEKQSQCPDAARPLNHDQDVLTCQMIQPGRSRPASVPCDFEGQENSGGKEVSEGQRTTSFFFPFVNSRNGIDSFAPVA